MKVLFVSSGNKKNGISPFVYNQGESLKKQNINLEYFTINDKGLKGYLRHLIPLRKKIKSEIYDVLHAHYSLSGFLTTLAAPFHSNIIVSLQGTIKKNTLKYILIHICNQFFWKSLIVKSEKMKLQTGIKNAHLIPNGVQIEKFKKKYTQYDLKNQLNLDTSYKHIIFVSDPERIEKNFKLAEHAIKLLNDDWVKLISVYNVSHNQVVKYMLAADALILTSFTEGSPNVIKEAMTACCPIVATNVGDIEYVIGNTKGCYITNFNLNNIIIALKKVLEFSSRTDGIKRIKYLGLDSDTISKKIINLYK